MVHLYKELQPSDHFEVSLPHFLSTNERHIITLLYQPLTGIIPIQVYFTLWAEVESDSDQKLTHYHLMNILGLPIGKIFEARIALEAIGLLRTWKKEDENGRSFIYELVRPLDPSTFFQDPLLSMFLFSKIGEHAYRNLRNRFVKEKNKDQYEEVSRTFVDVFKPVHTNVPKDLIDINETSAKDYPFYYNQFDFDLLMAGLSEQLVPSRALTTEVKKNIAKLAFLYQLSPIEMQKIVIAAFDETVMEIPFKRLKEAAASFYKLNVSNKPPKFEKTFEQVQTHEPTHSKEEEHLHYLETTSPIQLLKDLANGKEPLPSTVQLVENLVASHDMPVGVVNVLLEYVMITTDMKLPQKYVERIADHWMRKNIKTAKEAMELARKERDQYNKWKQENEKKVQNYTKKNQRKEEKVPDWFYNRNESQTTEETSVDFEKERQKILQKLGALDG